MSVSEAAERLNRFVSGESAASVYGPRVPMMTTAAGFTERQCNQRFAELLSDDCVQFAQSVCPEFSTAAISPELLKADGWEMEDRATKYPRFYIGDVQGQYSIPSRDFTFCGSSNLVACETIGEVRTQLRLRRDRLSRQSKPSSSTGEVGNE